MRRLFQALLLAGLVDGQVIDARVLWAVAGFVTLAIYALLYRGCYSAYRWRANVENKSDA